jgi:putative endonuclease
MNVKSKNLNIKMTRKILRKSKFYVYIVRCSDGTYYTGSTNNIENRIKLHNKGHGARYLRGKLPVKLVYAKEYRYYKNVLHAERNVKKLTRQEKEKLIGIYESKKGNS